MFPKDVGEFAYADLKTARKYSWFPQLREQMLPSRFRDFEKFLASAGVDPNTQVEELAWGSIQTSAGEDVVGVALGQFDPSSTEAHFKQQKIATVDVHGYHLFPFAGSKNAADILFTFIDSNTAAFGTRPALEKLIDVRTGTTQGLLTDDKLFPLINETNGNGLVWAVLDKNYTHIAMQQLVPQANQFPQAATIIDRLQAMTINVDADSGVDAHFQAVCSSTDDANLACGGVAGRTDVPPLPGSAERLRSGRRARPNQRGAQRQSAEGRGTGEPGSASHSHSHRGANHIHVVCVLGEGLPVGNYSACFASSAPQYLVNLTRNLPSVFS